MKKLIAVIVVIVVAIAGFAVYNYLNKAEISNDGTIGVTTFENLTEETGFGFDVDEESIPLEINLTKGELDIKITDGKNVIFEETDITESKVETVNFPNPGYYFLMLSGKKATGTVKYPVAKNSYTPSLVDETDKKAQEETENALKTPEGVLVSDALSSFYMGDNKNIEEVKIEKLKIYTKEEIANDDALKTYTLGEKDIVFDVSYTIIFKEASDEMMSYTAANGEIEGNKVINKYNCGFLVYDEKTDSYSIDNFGTGF